MADEATAAGALAQALEATGQLVAGVRPDQWDDPTPCAGWTVTGLVAHIVSGNQMFARIVSGELPGTPSPDTGPAGSELQTSYPGVARELVAGFSRPGVLEQTFTVPFGTVPGRVALHLRITEILVHGWDLARATGQQPRFPDGLAAAELQFSRGALGRIPEGRSPFGPPQPAPGGAAAIDQLAALLGRTV